MLLEQLYVEQALEAHAHLGEGMIELCVSFFEENDVNHNGRLDIDDFVKGMKAYARQPLAKDAAALHKRSHLEVEFSKADLNHDQQLTIGEFVHYVGRDGQLNIVPEAMAESIGASPALHRGTLAVRAAARPTPSLASACPHAICPYHGRL